MTQDIIVEWEKEHQKIEKRKIDNAFKKSIHMKKVCVECGKEFEGVVGGSPFCSMKCHIKFFDEGRSVDEGKKPSSVDFNIPRLIKPKNEQIKCDK